MGINITNRNLAIMIPLSFPWVPSSFFNSFVQMEMPDYTYITADNGHIEDLRNNLIESALNLKCTRGIMMDVDQVYHPKTITTLLAHKLPVVGALVHRRYPPFDSLMMKRIDIDEHTSGYASIDDWEEGELVEVDATGAGCLMFDLSIFRKLPYPWFKSGKNPDGTPIGEDFGFCRDLKAAGYKIFVDTSVPAGHLTTLVINTATNKLYRAMKSKAAQTSMLIDNEK